MAVTRIHTNQMADGIVTNAKIADTTIQGGKLADDLTYSSNFTVSGNLIVNGTTTTIDTVNTTIDDPINGVNGKAYPYTFISIDPDGDDVSYFIRWGDGKETDWTTFQASGPPGYTESHSWDVQGTYVIQAKAKDIYDVESDWAEHDIEIPRIRALSYHWMLDCFPLLERLLSLLLL